MALFVAQHITHPSFQQNLPPSSVKFYITATAAAQVIILWGESDLFVVVSPHMHSSAVQHIPGGVEAWSLVRSAFKRQEDRKALSIS